MLTRLFFLSWLTFMSVDFSFASEECPNQEKELAALKVLLKKTPEVLAKREAAEPNPRFFAVMGYAARYPGLTDDPGKLKCLLIGASTVPMPGTSDVLCSDEIIELQPAASRFAERYNRALARARAVNCP